MAKRKPSGAKRSKRKNPSTANAPAGKKPSGTMPDDREESLDMIEDLIPYVPEMDAFASGLSEPLGKLYAALKDALRCARYIQNHLQMFYPTPLDQIPDEKFANALSNLTARDEPRPQSVEWYERDKRQIVSALDYIDYIVDKYSLSERLLIEAHEKAQERADHKLVMSYYGYAHTTAFGAALLFCNEIQSASVEGYSPQIPTRDLQEDGRLDADLRLLFRMLDKLMDKTDGSNDQPGVEAGDIPDDPSTPELPKQLTLRKKNGNWECFYPGSPNTAPDVTGQPAQLLAMLAGKKSGLTTAAIEKKGITNPRRLWNDTKRGILLNQFVGRNTTTGLWYIRKDVDVTRGNGSIILTLSDSVESNPPDAPSASN